MPVGCEHLIFQSALVKPAVRESIDQRDIQTGIAQKFGELIQVRAFQQFNGLAVRQPQPEAKGFFRAKPPLQFWCVAPQSLEDLGPSFSGMNIRTISQLEARRNAHQLLAAAFGTARASVS